MNNPSLKYTAYNCMMKYIFVINHNKYFYLCINLDIKILILCHLSAFHVQQFITAGHYFESNRGRVRSIFSNSSITLAVKIIVPLFLMLISIVRKGIYSSLLFLEANAECSS